MILSFENTQPRKQGREDRAEKTALTRPSREGRALLNDTCMLHRSDDGYSPLFIACFNEHERVVEMLLSHPRIKVGEDGLVVVVEVVVVVVVSSS
jgi:hypothetical protein